MEFFIQTEASLLDFCEQDRVRRRPTTMRLVGSAIVLVDRDGSGHRLREMLRQMDELGPPAASPEEIDRRRYAVSDLLADLETGTDDEALAVAATLLREAGDLLLTTQKRWSGSGKWLLREIEALDHGQGTHHAGNLMHGVRSAAANNTTPLQQAVRTILDQAGGPLFSGYRITAKLPSTIDIRPASPDDAGIPGLLALATNDAKSAIESYRSDSAAALLGATVHGDLVGILGYIVSDSMITVRHIATAARLRRTASAPRCSTCCASRCQSA